MPDMALLVVESPSKAKTIAKYLGAGWHVRASVGHFRDLPPNPKDGLGVDMKTFRPVYELRNKKVVSELRSAASKADRILIATDPDREGEAIAWHIAHVLKIKGQCNRVTFNEVTETVVRSAVNQPRGIDMNLVAAQEARRVLDRLIGYQVSPVLGYQQSAGRVQSPALRLVVEREHAIANFKPEAHFGVRATDLANRFTADWDTQQVLGADERYVTDRGLADHIAQTTTLTVLATETKPRRAKPPMPFWTSTLQQAASSHLEMRPEDTMKAAQGLYEGGHITYLRTDSPHISEEAQAAIRAYLVQAGVPIPEVARQHAPGAHAQEAHECIRPTDIAKKIAGANEAEQRLYRLIRLRTLASQMTPAVYEVTSALFDSDVALPDGTPARFHARGERCIDKGWTAALGDGSDTDEDDEEDAAKAPLPAMTVGEAIPVSSARLDKSTQAPRRYTEATLTKALEKYGIGRPSTYASIMAGLRRRAYILVKRRKLHATEAGCAVIDALIKADFSFINYDYTEHMESQLDRIAAGNAEYRQVVAGGHDELKAELQALRSRAATSSSGVEVRCPSCNAFMRRIPSKNGAFWGCTAYPDCRTTLPDNDGEPGAAQPAAEVTDVLCDACGKPMVKRVARKKRKGDPAGGAPFLGCSGYPACKETRAIPTPD